MLYILQARLPLPVFRAIPESKLNLEKIHFKSKDEFWYKRSE